MSCGGTAGQVHGVLCGHPGRSGHLLGWLVLLASPETGPQACLLRRREREAGASSRVGVGWAVVACSAPRLRASWLGELACAGGASAERT